MDYVEFIVQDFTVKPYVGFKQYRSNSDNIFNARKRFTIHYNLTYPHLAHSAWP